MTSAYENAMSNMQAENYTQTYPVTQNQAAEARAEQAEQERDAALNQYHDLEQANARLFNDLSELRSAYLGSIKTIEQLRRELGQAQKDLSDYRAEIERLTKKVWTS